METEKKKRGGRTRDKKKQSPTAKFLMVNKDGLGKNLSKIRDVGAGHTIF